ncbi:MAG: hypothetical protein FWC26_11060 [Fibromonadales bacterium]|nr:hypothetical protein [Fibromonadales bacterium]
MKNFSLIILYFFAIAQGAKPEWAKNPPVPPPDAGHSFEIGYGIDSEPDKAIENAQENAKDKSPDKNPIVKWKCTQVNRISDVKYEAWVLGKMRLHKGIDDLDFPDGIECESPIDLKSLFLGGFVAATATGGFFLWNSNDNHEKAKKARNLADKKKYNDNYESYKTGYIILFGVAGVAGVFWLWSAIDGYSSKPQNAFISPTIFPQGDAMALGLFFNKEF